jgi:hypothetical protein
VRLDVSNRFSNRPVRLGNSHAASPPVRSVQTTGISFFSFWGETRRLVVTVERLINDLQSQSLFRCNSCTLFRLQYAPRGISYIRRLNPFARLNGVPPSVIVHSDTDCVNHRDQPPDNLSCFFYSHISSRLLLLCEVHISPFSGRLDSQIVCFEAELDSLHSPASYIQYRRARA